MIRWLYRCLLRLHPASFRGQFAGEMLWIFDEATSGGGAGALFADGFASLARQWLLRTGMWKAAAGGTGAFVLIGGMLSMAALPISHLQGPDPEDFDFPPQSAAAAPAQFNGHWAGYFQFPGPAGWMEFTLAENGGVWNGALWVRGPDGVMHQGMPEDIQVRGDGLSFRFQSNHGEMVYRGRMIQGKLRGYVRSALR